jgi:hypothetical protein
MEYLVCMILQFIVHWYWSYRSFITFPLSLYSTG